MLFSMQRHGRRGNRAAPHILRLRGQPLQQHIQRREQRRGQCGRAGGGGNAVAAADTRARVGQAAGQRVDEREDVATQLAALQHLAVPAQGVNAVFANT